ncbi:methyltransferase [Desulfobacca acetoxidans]|uniref:O-methyltransferase family 2 n=1 Tax=Desulfobacca acetoxidans (strain ATCC 700848 / DSM 11109 / ASRB2) TaxID=880072 RepID=F2NJA2_DESAR|nr:methyltransferase [Desulfobacca acetoxidans]AEB09274.1 O-methyltransferase family 2 [Desulfobacca acetoxidans DSM 11109]
MKPSGDLSGFAQLMELSRGFQAAKVFLVACDLDVFSHLSIPTTVEDLASRLQVNARALEMLLNGLTALRLLSKKDNSYHNTPVAQEFLVAAGENYRGAIFKHLHHTWEGWSDLGAVVATGNHPKIDPARWVEAHAEAHEQEVKDFIWGMHAVARDTIPLVLEQLNLKDIKHLLDLGGGPASYAIAFAQQYPQLKATVFDLPLPISIARENLVRHGLTSRVQTIAGNFLEDDIGSGYDFIWISQILHSHTETQSQTILRKACSALVPGGRLAVHDFFLDDDGYTPPSAAFFGLHMLAVTQGGRAYKHHEVATWVESLGCSRPELRRVGEHSSFVIAVKNG